MPGSSLPPAPVGPSRPCADPAPALPTPTVHPRFVKRRAGERFREMQQSTNPEAIAVAWDKGLAELEVVRRQSIIYGLYAPKEKSVMVCGAAVPDRARQSLVVRRDVAGPGVGGVCGGWKLPRLGCRPACISGSGHTACIPGASP